MEPGVIVVGVSSLDGTKNLRFRVREVCENIAWVFGWLKGVLDGHNEETDRNLLRETKCRSGSDSADFQRQPRSRIRHARASQSLFGRCTRSLPGARHTA